MLWILLRHSLDDLIAILRDEFGEPLPCPGSCSAGIPQLDQGYTVYGEVVKGLDVVDKIATVQTSRAQDRDRPLQDVRIIKAKLIKRKR